MSMNVLVTAIGSFSASAVIGSLLKDERIDRVFGCDVFPKEWHYISNDFEEVFLAPYVSNEKMYHQFIKNLIVQHNIDLIIPLTDVEVDFFNKFRIDFDNVLVTIGNSEFISVARDKEKLTHFLKENRFNYPKSYSIENIEKANYPLIGKPRNGRSSEGVFILNSADDLSANKDYSNYIFQEIIKGNVITVDVLRSKETHEIRLIPRKELIRTKNGAGLTVELFFNEKLNSLVQQICKILNADGVFNMEFIQTEEEYYLIDINPRFSAGIGFTCLMGYDIVYNTLNLFLQEKLDPIGEYKNMIAQKHMVDVVIKVN